MRGLPASAFAKEPEHVSDEASISLPFRLIQPQLSTGRITLPISVFIASLPEAYRDVIATDAGLTEVPLPLQEIFLNLPSSALSIRADQIVEEAGSTYLTPFSQKAEEDAKRFTPSNAAPPVLEEPAAAPAKISPPETVPESEAVADAEGLFAPLVEEPKPATEMGPTPAAPVPTEAPSEPPRDEKPVSTEVEAAGDVRPAPSSSAETDEPPAAIETVDEPKPKAKAGAGASQPAPLTPAETVLQKLFMTEDELDAKTVVKLVSQLPGINGCAVMFGDGLRLAGNFPENGHAEGFSAMSPPFYKRTMNFASELKLGELQAFTIYTDTGLLSFFMHDDICMSVRHAGRGFLPGVREKLETVTRELAQMYSAPPASASN